MPEKYVLLRTIYHLQAVNKKKTGFSCRLLRLLADIFFMAWFVDCTRRILSFIGKYFIILINWKVTLILAVIILKYGRLRETHIIVCAKDRPITEQWIGKADDCVKVLMH